MEQEDEENCKCNQGPSSANSHFFSKIHASELGATAANIKQLSLHMTLQSNQSPEWALWWFYKAFSEKANPINKHNKSSTRELQSSTKEIKITHTHEFHFSVNCSEIESFENGEISKIIEIIDILPDCPEYCKRKIHINVIHGVCKYITCPQVNYLPPADFICHNKCPAKASSLEYSRKKKNDYFFITQTLKKYM